MDRKDGEECSDSSGSPYNPTEGTTCCSQFHGSPGQHCCGTEVYLPHADICCSGHRHPKEKGTHCCGVQAYNMTNKEMKCCAGSLYNLTQLGRLDAQCCGSVLQEPSEVCCRSENGELLYSAKPGLRCCGHLYYNTTLWSCCAGKLHPGRRPLSKKIHKSMYLSMTNLNETDLCKEMYIGTVESVSLHSIVFSSVLKIHGRPTTVQSLPSTYILKIHFHCNSPKLTPGKTYFFNHVNVFTDFSRDSVSTLLYFIISKCDHL